MSGFLRVFFSVMMLGMSGPLRAQDSPLLAGDVTDVQVIHHLDSQPGANLLWIPYVAQLKPQHLIVAFGAGIPGKVDMGDILASVSTNDGKTWSPVTTVFDHRQRIGGIQYAYANPILFHPSGQEIVWCFCMRCPIYATHSEDSGLAAAYSGDGGRSWTPVELTMLSSGPLVIVAGIHEIRENGVPRYLLPGQRNTLRSDPHGTREQFVLSSTSLLEWKLAGYVPLAPGADVFPHEGNIAAGEKPGELKMVHRTAKLSKEGQAVEPPTAYSSTSTDGGRTWSVAKPEPDLWNTVSKPFYGTVGSGQHIYVYNDGPAWSRMALRYKIQDAAGNWGPEKTFYDSGTKNSYPTLIEVAPGDFRAVWDSGTKDRMRTHIRFGKLRVPMDEKANESR